MSWISWKGVGGFRVFGWLKFNLQFLFFAGCWSQLSVNFRSYTISSSVATNWFVDVNIDKYIEGNLTQSCKRLAWKLLWPPFLLSPPSGAQFLNRDSLSLGSWQGKCCRCRLWFSAPLVPIPWLTLGTYRPQTPGEDELRDVRGSAFIHLWCIHSLVRSFIHKCLLSTYHVPGEMGGDAGRKVTREDFMKSFFDHGEDFFSKGIPIFFPGTPILFVFHNKNKVILGAVFPCCCAPTPPSDDIFAHICDYFLRTESWKWHSRVMCPKHLHVIPLLTSATLEIIWKLAKCGWPQPHPHRCWWDWSKVGPGLRESLPVSLQFV